MGPIVLVRPSLVRLPENVHVGVKAFVLVVVAVWYVPKDAAGCEFGSETLLFAYPRVSSRFVDLVRRSFSNPAFLEFPCASVTRTT